MSPIWFTDMTNAGPPEVFSDTMRKRHWRAVEYETADQKGTLIFAGPETQAPELTLKLGLTGWHAVYVGLWGPAGGVADMGQSVVRLKVTGEACFRKIEKENPGMEDLEEAFYKSVDLTQSDLVISQSALTPGSCAGIAYIRCEPISSEQVAQIKQDRRQHATKRLISTNDAEGIFRWMPTTKEDIWEFIEPLADSDYAELYWGIVGEHVGYPTSVGQLYGAGQDDFSATDLRRAKESLEALINRGINPLATAIEYAHSIGLKIHLYQRMGAFAALPPYDEAFGSAFYRDHPEFRCVTADGRTIMRLSLAYPEVRAFMVALLREAAELGLDGVNLNYKRGAPFVGYETPLAEGFKQETGRDPRQLDEWDEQWLRYRARVVTQFMREVRQAMDQVGKKTGKRLEISATTHPTPEECLFFGLDLKTWIQEGLVENLVPMGLSHQGKEVDLAFYRTLVEGTRCRFSPHLPYAKELRDGCGYDTKPTISAIRDYALRYFEGGADGLCIWDSDRCLDTKASLGPAVRRLGHIDELKALVEGKHADRGPKLMPLTSLGGYDLTVRDIPADNKRIYPHGTPHHAWLGL